MNRRFLWVALLGFAAATPSASRAQLNAFATDSGVGAGGWTAVLRAAGYPRVRAEQARLVVSRDGPLSVAAAGGVVITTGASPAAAAVGVRAGADSVLVRRERDVHDTTQLILWRDTQRIPRFRLPPRSVVFSREWWTGAPLLAAIPHGRGHVLWSATDPGARGFERLPYAAHALADLGLGPPLEGRGLRVFYDYAYRSRTDVGYMAPRWRAMGVGTLYVSAWHFVEPDSARDAYLRALIDAAHRNGIRVYAWLELPHVSEAFWAAHPEWRERNGLLQDAVVFWRKNMNLVNREASAAAARVTTDLLMRFDWDGANLSELYFEGLRGVEDPSLMTPLNDDVRADVRARHGFDPANIFVRGAPEYHGTDRAFLTRFLQYRVALQTRLHEEWLAVLDDVRKRKGSFGIVVCYVDDVSEPTMRDLIGADVRAIMPLANRYGAEVLIQDPFVLWSLGPERYRRIAEDLWHAAPEFTRLAIDINIVARQANAFPIDHQSGTELLQLVHTAQQVFPAVALYAEHSILPVDRRLMAAALSTADTADLARDGTVHLGLRRITGVRWSGPAAVNGAPWPFADGRLVWLPPGSHTVSRASVRPHTRLLDFNGELTSVELTERGVSLRYSTDARAIAILDRAPRAVLIDGAPADVRRLSDGARTVLLLPAGAHRAEIVTR